MNNIVGECVYDFVQFSFGNGDERPPISSNDVHDVELFAWIVTLKKPDAMTPCLKPNFEIMNGLEC